MFSPEVGRSASAEPDGLVIELLRWEVGWHNRADDLTWT